MNLNFMAIYAIINILDDKMYIGSAKNYRLRKNLHSSKLDQGINDSHHLQRAYTKYGKENFIFVILERINKAENLLIREQWWIDVLETTNQAKGYNLRKIAESNLGIFVKQSTREKLSKLQTGRIKTEEEKRKIAETLRGRKNKPHSEETKRKMSLASLGKKKSEDHKNKMREGWSNRKGK